MKDLVNKNKAFSNNAYLDRMVVGFKTACAISAYHH
jgi:hypothetical protein